MKKNKIKKASMSEISVLVQIDDVILAPLFSADPIQILLNLTGQGMGFDHAFRSCSCCYAIADLCSPFSDCKWKRIIKRQSGVPSRGLCYEVSVCDQL